MLQAETKQSEGEETDSTFVTQPKVAAGQIGPAAKLSWTTLYFIEL